MKGIMSLAYSIAVDKLVREREKKKKVLQIKNQIREIVSYVSKSKVSQDKRSEINRKLINFSKEIENYSLDKLENAENTIEILKLGAKVLNYTSGYMNITNLTNSLENVIKRIEFSEFVDSKDFEYELVNKMDQALSIDDYIIDTFKNKVLLELRNRVRYEKVVNTLVKNFSTVPPMYFLDKKVREYKFKKKEKENNETILYFSHGKTLRVVYSKSLDLDNLIDDVTVFVIPQMNKNEKELVRSYFDRDYLVMAYSIFDNKIYYNKDDARTIYFRSYLSNKIPSSSNRVLLNAVKKRGNYAPLELGIDEMNLPTDIDDFWR